MHSARLSPYDFERLLIDLVERLADEYEADVDIGTIVKSVRRARDLLGNDGLDAPAGGIEPLERLSRQLIDARRPAALSRIDAGPVEAGLAGRSTNVG